MLSLISALLFFLTIAAVDMTNVCPAALFCYKEILSPKIHSLNKMPCCNITLFYHPFLRFEPEKAE
jgi:hypothetical protein